MDTLKDIELSVLDRLKQKFTPTIYELWFKSMQLVSLDGETAVFSTDSNFKQDLISKRHAASIKDALREVVGFDVQIVVVSRESSEGFHIPEIEEKPEENKKPSSILPEEPESKPIDPEAAIEGPSIVDEYTFDNFIEGESNRFALAACRAVAQYSAVINHNTRQRNGDGFPLPLRDVPLVFVAYVAEDNLRDVDFLVLRRDVPLGR